MQYPDIYFKPFYYTKQLRNEYGANTYRLRSGMKNYRAEVLDAALFTITGILYYSI